VNFFSNLTAYQLKQAWLSLKKKPGFVVSVVSTMGITLGALLCVLTLAYVMLLKPLPYPEQDKLVVVKHEFIDENGRVDVSAFPYPSAMYLYENNQVFDLSSVAIYQESIVTSLNEQPRVNTAAVTSQWFQLFAPSFALGRGFEQTEAIGLHQPVAIISHDTWVNHYHSDSQILNKKLTLSGISYSIIGVVAKNFIEPQIHGVGLKNDIWLPLDFNSIDERYKTNWGAIGGNIAVVGKLKNDMSAAQASQQLTLLISQVWQENVTHIEHFKGWEINVSVTLAKKIILADSAQSLYLLLAGVIGLVIIATANIANLFISQTVEKRSHLAINVALGAKKSHLFNSLFAQAFLLNLLAILLALAISWCGFVFIKLHLASRLPLSNVLSINLFTIAAAITLLLTFSVLFAYVSRKAINLKSINTLLKSSGKGIGFQVTKRHRQLLIISQITVATVLVFVNMSLFKNAMGVIEAPLGFNTENRMYLNLSPSSATYPAREEISPIMKEIKRKLLQLPQVSSVSQSPSPLDIFRPSVLKIVENGKRLTPERLYVDSDYFQVIEQKLVAGNYFTAADIKDRNRVIIVNDALADRLSLNSDVLGMKVKLGDAEIYKIVGIVQGIKMPGKSQVPIRFYRPASPFATRMLIKLKEQQQLSREQVISLLSDVSRKWSVFDFESLADTRQKKLFTHRVTVITSAVLILITIFLAGIGLYGVLSYSCQMRRFEIGTRMAIGAKGKDILRLIFKDNFSSLLLSTIASILILVSLYLGFNNYLTVYINSELFMLFIFTLILILLISLIACYLPLRQYISKPVIDSLRGSE
jgi:predicted permease